MYTETPPPTDSYWASPTHAMACIGVRSRQTLYKRLAEWEALGLPRPYVDINPTGKYAIRRFNPDLLAQCLRDAEKISASQKESRPPAQNQ